MQALYPLQQRRWWAGPCTDQGPVVGLQLILRGPAGLGCPSRAGPWALPLTSVSWAWASAMLRRKPVAQLGMSVLLSCEKEKEALLNFWWCSVRLDKTDKIASDQLSSPLVRPQTAEGRRTPHLFLFFSFNSTWNSASTHRCRRATENRQALTYGSRHLTLTGLWWLMTIHVAEWPMMHQNGRSLSAPIYIHVARPFARSQVYMVWVGDK